MIYAHSEAEPRCWWGSNGALGQPGSEQGVSLPAPVADSTHPAKPPAPLLFGKTDTTYRIVRSDGSLIIIIFNYGIGTGIILPNYATPIKQYFSLNIWAHEDVKYSPGSL